ncbi:unnamed protein product [Dovyalis caffra]|uniref:NAC domain-containing protein n=1 Tax=Dovyalis caffra TaxID=77055 RepID=A0AAV1SCN3_9ROSI|nr:unnamed protein product [Dovyalis caffra]
MGPTYIRDQWLWNDELLSEVDSVRELRVDVLDIEAHRKRYKRADQSKVTSRTMSSQTPVGYGFHPTDEELVNHYLRFKMHGGYEEEVSRIPEVNRDFVLCKLKKDPDEIIPTYEEGDSSFNATSGFENQNSNECYYPPTFEEGEYGARMASNFTNSEPEDDINQVQAHLQSFHGFDEGDYNLNAALQFSYGNMH